MSSVITLLFAPSFLVLIQYFSFQLIVSIYILLSFIVLVYAFLKRKKAEDFIIISIYLVLLSIAYISNSFQSVKFIPVFSAMTFFTIFAYSSIKKKELIFNFTKKFYKKDLGEAESMFLKDGDKFWAVAILLYAVFLLSLVYYGDDRVWAFFSSVGWYIYFVLTLVTQIIYGKVYAIKMYS